MLVLTFDLLINDQSTRSELLGTHNTCKLILKHGDIIRVFLLRILLYYLVTCNIIDSLIAQVYLSTNN